MNSTTAGDSLALVADIGGTNARFALVDPDNKGAPTLLARQALECSRFASLQHAAEYFLQSQHQRPTRAAIAVASPIVGDDVRMVNRAWAFNRSELMQRLGLEALHILNDFGAIARSVPLLQQGDLEWLHGDPRQPLASPISVLGPGTGLGVALLIEDRAGGHQVVETEGGHVSFAPLGSEEQQICRWISQRHGRTSNERLLSGSGLSQIDAALRGPEIASDAPLREPSEIVAAALDGHDVLARRSLARFCAVLGSVAGDCALIHGARSVVIAGGIVPRFVPFLRSSAFRERFLAKGRFADYLARVSIVVITHPDPGLLGAAMTLRSDAPRKP